MANRGEPRRARSIRACRPCANGEQVAKEDKVTCKIRFGTPRGAGAKELQKTHDNHE